MAPPLREMSPRETDTPPKSSLIAPWKGGATREGTTQKVLESYSEERLASVLGP